MKADYVTALKEDGFVSMPGLLCSEIEWIRAEFDSISVQYQDQFRLCTTGAATRHRFLIDFLGRTARLASLLDTPLLVDRCKEFCGSEYNYLGSDASIIAGPTRWHADGVQDHYPFVKFAVYFDLLTAGNGLRFIPRSHLVHRRNVRSLHSSLTTPSPLNTDATAVKAVSIRSQPGDVIAFSYNTLHSVPGDGPRHLFTFSISERFLDADVALLKERMRGRPESLWASRTRLFGEHITDSASSERWMHLQQPLANDPFSKCST